MSEAESIRVIHHSIAADDGPLLAATLYRPAQPLERLLLINNAMGTSQSFYADFARGMAERGFTVMTWDYRGTGQSTLDKAERRKIELWQWGALDADAIMRWLIRQFPAQPLTVLGHSLGGQIVGLSPTAEDIAGFIGVCAQSAYAPLWPGLASLKMRLNWRMLVPLAARLRGELPLGDGVPKRVALDWARAARRPGYLIDYYGPAGHNYYADVSGPSLWFSFSDDTLAPKRAVEALQAFYPNAQPMTEHHVRPAEIGLEHIGHFGYFRPGAARLWDETAEWLRGV